MLFFYIPISSLLLDINVDLANSCKVSVKVIGTYFNIADYYHEVLHGNKIEDDEINEFIVDGDNCVDLHLVESTSNSQPLVVAQFIEYIRINREEDEDEGHKDEQEDEDGGIPYHGYLKTIKFEVYQLNLIEGNNNSNSGTSTSSSYECNLVSNLDDQVLFIGHCGTLLLSATRNSANGNGHGGPRGNCIYFVDEKNYGGYYYSVVSRESGVFSIANTKIYRNLPSLKFGANHFYWFTPSPSL